jgi:hypothetical protein
MATTDIARHTNDCGASPFTHKTIAVQIIIASVIEPNITESIMRVFVSVFM